MPECQNNTISLDAVQDYFSHLNPIAQKIARDIRDTKSIYGQLWNQLHFNEQNDIINTALINPEITMKYFDNSSSLSSCALSSSSATDSRNVLCHLSDAFSKSVSTDSLSAEVFKNANSYLSTISQKPQQRCDKRTSKSKSTMLSKNNCYAYDGQHLKTFGLQKVALKIIQDDVLGTFRDEHSLPFSYRTKSQINLHIFDNSDQTQNVVSPIEQDEDEICLLGRISCKQLQSSMSNKFQNQTVPKQNKIRTKLKLNLSSQFDNQVVIPNQDDFEYVIKPRAKLLQSKPTNSTNAKTVTDCKNSVTIVNSSKNEVFLKDNLASTTISTTSCVTYAVYTDEYFDREDGLNLMRNCSNSGLLTASSLSATTSDDDHDNYDDDDKTLCEHTKLLDNDNYIRKGFDFLNNW